MLERTDWQYETMKDICYVNQGFQINIEKREKHKRKNNKIYITIQHLNGVGDNEYIKDIDHNDSVVCSPDDVLMTRTGNTGRVVTGVSGVFHNNFFRINFDRSRIDKDYLVYYLNQKNIQNLILEKAGASTIPDLNHGDFYSIPFNYPKELKEQRRIAKTLTNIDNLIDLMTLLIEKKVNIRNGIIYKIFNEKNNWKKIELKHVLQYEQPSKYIVFNTDYVNSGIPVLTAGKSFILGYTNENTGIYNKGKCILFDDFTTDIKKVDFKFKVKSSAVKMLTPVNDNYDLDFLYYAMSNINYVPVTHNRHWISIYSKFEIFIPNTLEEQKKISSILINADNEIEALKEKLSKYQKIKDGMMEDLLTGKVRLSYE